MAARIELRRRPAEPMFLSLAVRLEARDPWCWLAREAATEETRLAWHEPTAGLSFVAQGTAGAILLRGGGRIRDAAAWCSFIAEHHVWLGPGERPPQGEPLVLASLAFRPRGPGEDPGPWAAFADGLLWVPRVLVSARGGETWATFHERLGAHEPARAAAQRLLAGRQRLLPRGPGGGSDGSFDVTAATVAERRDWERRSSRAIAALEGDGALSKVVLARAAEHRAPPGHIFDPVATAEALRARHGGCTVFAIERPGGPSFVGATPELLVRVRGAWAETRALAGTTPRGADATADAALARTLVAAAKDRREHELVVSALEEALGAHARGAVSVAGPRLRSLADVHHLETAISAELDRPGRLWDLLEALHPTPAVGGVPREAALAWLAEHEGLDRGAYAGPIGWVDTEGAGVFHVALRSALLMGDRALAYAGAGLVPGSSPAGEWAETEHKLRAIRAALRVRAASGGAA
ncbi:MAG: isochorismate synthase [Deltaproteobacteria bacterium]|nr:isochorismate synthase [Deltaproteobacteria bacterium]